MKTTKGFSVFPDFKNDQLKEPMFLGNNINVARYDQQKWPIFEKLVEKQLSFFWRPEEINITSDKLDYDNMSQSERHIFVSNLKYQTLLDSIQGRAPSVVFGSICSLPELENWVKEWEHSETIHSRSYTHIIRGVVNDPSIIFDDIVVNDFIKKRAEQIAFWYDECYRLNRLRENYLEDPVRFADYDKAEHARAIYLCLHCANALEAIRFFVSFACTFAFAERELMEGNANIVKLIARDEFLHLQGTQAMIKLIDSGAEGEFWKGVAQSCRDEAIQIFDEAEAQELDWADYLFKDGSMIGLNKNILCSYVKYISNMRRKEVGLPYEEIKNNPIPWIENHLESKTSQVAPQEAELSNYLSGQVDTDLTVDDFSEFNID